jgi:CSLREA domain-containing protein
VRTIQAKRALRLLAGVALLTGLGLTAQRAHAQTYTVVNLLVNTTADDPGATCGMPGPPPHVTGACSLRGAATFANSASSATAYFVVNVTVPAHTYYLTPANGPITFSNAYTKTHLNGGSPTSTIVDGQNGTQIFFNSGSNLTIQNMTLQRGNGSGGNGGALLSAGGALALTNVLVQNNTATGFSGGGLFIADNVDNLTRVVARNNEAQFGGGIYAAPSASNFLQLTVNNNLACVTYTAPTTCGGDGQGGGLFATGNTTIQSSSFFNNVAGSLALADLSGEGGAIYNGSVLHLVTVRINNNIAGNDGGGLYGTAGKYESIHNSNFDYNQAGNQGGALWVSTVDYITGSVVQNNTAGVAPTGGVSPTPGNDGFGGGMYATGTNAQQIAGTQFSSNSALTASSTPAGTCGGEGGGLYNASEVSLGGDRIAFNIACNGGGIFDDSTTAGNLSINATSIAQNIARIQGGGIYSNYTGQPAIIGIDGSAITGNSAADAGGLYDSGDPAGFLESNYTVILGNSTTVAGNCHNIGDLPCN